MQEGRTFVRYSTMGVFHAGEWWAAQCVALLHVTLRPDTHPSICIQSGAIMTMDNAALLKSHMDG